MCFDEFQLYMKDFCEDRKDLQEVKSVVEKRQEDFKQDTEPFSPSRFEDKLRLDKKRGDLLSNLLVNNTVLTTDEIFGEIFIFLVAGTASAYLAGSGLNSYHIRTRDHRTHAWLVRKITCYAP